MRKEFNDLNGNKAIIDVPEPRDGSSIFVVAGHKTGSVLLSKIIDDISIATGLPSIAVESSVWSQGFSIKDWPCELYEFLEDDGYVFHSFRWLQKLPELDKFNSSKKVFMIRDPRDIVVSYYYSMRKSHTLPEKGKSRESIIEFRKETESIDVDIFVQSGMAGPILRNIQRFSDFYDREDAVFYKYEEIIFDKRNWVMKIANDLSVELSREQADLIADKHDLMPVKEDPNAHVRSVKPGGYLKKLSKESINYIHKNYPIFFEKFGYS